MAKIQKIDSTSVDQGVENPHTLLAGVSSGTASKKSVWQLRKKFEVYLT